MTHKTEAEHPIRGFRSRLKRNFITGLLILVPLLGTFFLFTWGFNKITTYGLAKLRYWPYFNDLYLAHETSYNIIGRLIVIFALFGIVVLAGFFARNFVGRRIITLADKILERIPLFNRIFLALKQISRAFIGSNRALFSYVVMFEWPRKGIYCIGFVMSESKGEVQDKTSEDILSIFLPTTPNPTSGFFLMVPRKDTQRLEMAVEDALKMIISGGAIVPPYKKTIHNANP